MSGWGWLRQKWGQFRDWLLEDASGRSIIILYSHMTFLYPGMDRDGQPPPPPVIVLPDDWGQDGAGPVWYAGPLLRLGGDIDGGSEDESDGGDDDRVGDGGDGGESKGGFE